MLVAVHVKHLEDHKKKHPLVKHFAPTFPISTNTELPIPDPSELQTSFYLGDDLYDLVLKNRLLTRTYEARLEFVSEMEKQLEPALHFLHSEGFTHGDIKLENIVYSDETKLFTFIDFEFSTRKGNEHEGNYRMGTPNMLPPLTELEHYDYVGGTKELKRLFHDLKSCDWFCFGLTCYSLLFLSRPFAFSCEVVLPNEGFSFEESYLNGEYTPLETIYWMTQKFEHISEHAYKGPTNLIETIRNIHAFARDDRQHAVALKKYYMDGWIRKVGGWEQVCLRLIRAFDSVGSRIHDRHVFFIPRKKKMT